jgi:hypothetical protein
VIDETLEREKVSLSIMKLGEKKNVDERFGNEL